MSTRTAPAAMDPAAFHDFLDCLSMAVKYAAAGDTLTAELVQLGASAAALRAFPVGTPESAALETLLAAALRMREVTS